MAVYAIGDVQGCYSKLCRLLEKLNFDPASDKLWFCGDLVNRGPESLETLRFIKSLKDRAVTVLGNHDLHLLALYHGGKKVSATDSLFPLLNSPDCAELLEWLQSKPLLHYDPDHKAILVHAGVHPEWTLEQAISLAAEMEALLQGAEMGDFFRHMYGDKPDQWSQELNQVERWRCITNVLTRMRYFSAGKVMDFEVKSGPDHADASNLTPWYALQSAIPDEIRIFFGHWSTLKIGRYGRHFALDGGCVWGGKFAAVQIDSDDLPWTCIDC